MYIEVVRGRGTFRAKIRKMAYKMAILRISILYFPFLDKEGIRRKGYMEGMALNGLDIMQMIALCLCLHILMKTIRVILH